MHGGHATADTTPWRNGTWRSLVSVSVWGTEGPGFKSRRPDHVVLHCNPVGLFWY